MIHLLTKIVEVIALLCVILSLFIFAAIARYIVNRTRPKRIKPKEEKEINMSKIEFLKEDRIRLNGITYRPYKVCELPTSFGFIYDEEKDMRGMSEWIKYKSLIYIAE